MMPLIHKEVVLEPNNPPQDSTLLRVENLKMHFPVRTNSVLSTTKKYIYAVDGVSFSLKEGEVFGLVGESGCGKSSVARTIIRLNTPTAGNIWLQDTNLATAQGKELLALRRNIQMIFQDPYASLNPRMTVASLIAEPFHIFKSYNLLNITTQEIEERIDTLLEQVGLRPSMKKRFPHEFSGGQRQRIGIARAIAIYPKVVIADEPISALDVSVQAQILNLLQSLQEKLNLTYIFIAHDLAVVNYISNKIAVMYLGKIVEIMESGNLTKESTPLHPYTKMLLDAVLVPDPTREHNRDHTLVQGEVSTRMTLQQGCPFYNRCPLRMDKCKESSPELKEVAPNRFVACFLHE